GAAVAGDVRDESRMFVDAEALVVDELADLPRRRFRESAPGRERHPDAVLAEPDDVAHLVVVHVGHEARVFVVEPAAGVGCERLEPKPGGRKPRWRRK